MPCAEAQLDRFKSQELGMLLWAVAKLAYMPAASLVRAALPVVAEWRTPTVQVSKWQFSVRSSAAAVLCAHMYIAAALPCCKCFHSVLHPPVPHIYMPGPDPPPLQDCGNTLWAFTILGILTPEVMQLLSGKLLALPREAFTQEAFIQLYQAKMSLSQQVGFMGGQKNAFWCCARKGELPGIGKDEVQAELLHCNVMGAVADNYLPRSDCRRCTLWHSVCLLTCWPGQRRSGGCSRECIKSQRLTGEAVCK
jgi:hypothetical protein